MRVLVLFVVAAVLAAVPGNACGAQRKCAQCPGANVVRPADELAKSMRAATGQFASDVYSQLGKSSSDNLLFSPISISVTMTMTAAGARGRTQTEMAKALCLGDKLDAAHGQYRLWLVNWNAPTTERGYELRMANRLWVQDGFPLMRPFVALTSRDYGTEIGQLDFQADPEGSRLAINQWVEEQTANKIQDLFPPDSIKKDSRLVLANAVYFKGEWRNPFKESETRDRDFTVAGSRKVKVPMMHQQRRFQYHETSSVQVLQMGYQKNISMTIVLPRRANGLAALERNLSEERLQEWLDRLSPREVNVTMPKFRMETSYDLVETLKAMGMKLAFSRNGADFSGISSRADLYISSAVHKAYIDVSEKGTEAAAATGARMGMGAAGIQPEPVAEFLADRPFLFLIQDQMSGCILFLGRVANPQE